MAGRLLSMRLAASFAILVRSRSFCVSAASRSRIASGNNGRASSRISSIDCRELVIISTLGISLPFEAL